MKKKNVIKVSKRGIFIAAGVLLVIGLWITVWVRVSRQVEHAAYEDAFSQLTFGGAYYMQCDAETVGKYISDVTAVDASLCGTQLGNITIPTTDGAVDCPLYACKPLEHAGKENALILAERGGSYYAYELVGFPYLDDSPSIWAVCASYGIGAAEDLASVSIYDADGTPLYDIADADKLADFFDKFVKLGANLSDEETAQAYYNAYVAEYGADDKLILRNGNVEATDDETYDKAMALWSEGVCLVTIRLQNGLQLRDCIYAPVPGLFSVYGIYPITEPFF